MTATIYRNCEECDHEFEVTKTSTGQVFVDGYSPDDFDSEGWLWEDLCHLDSNGYECVSTVIIRPSDFGA